MDTPLRYSAKYLLSTMHISTLRQTAKFVGSFTQSDIKRFMATLEEKDKRLTDFSCTLKTVLYFKSGVVSS